MNYRMICFVISRILLMEAALLARLFGNGPAVLAPKSWLGHTSAACGALELACVVFYVAGGGWRSLAVLAAGVLDLVIGLLMDNVPGIALPFEYNVFFCALVVVWYILTELGSIIENAGALGAPVPGWMKSAIAALQDRVDESAGETHGQP